MSQAQAQAGAGGSAIGTAPARLSARDVLAEQARIASEQDPTGSGAALFRRLLERDAVDVPMRDGHATITSLDQVMRIARMLWAAGIKPGGCESEAQVTVAVLAGMEAGLTIGQTCKGVYVVNGVPSLWGDIAWGLVIASGKMAAHREWTEGAGDDLTACIMVERRGEAPIERRFSRAQAAAAGLVTKGPWRAYLPRMLQMRARALAMRDAFPDVLVGLSIAEEQQDIAAGDPAGGAAPTPAAVPDPVGEAIDLAAAVRTKRATPTPTPEPTPTPTPEPTPAPEAVPAPAYGTGDHRAEPPALTPDTMFQTDPVVYGEAPAPAPKKRIKP